MADIFISYAREDRPQAERLAHALQLQGWSVWWDVVIPAGKSFDDVIDEAMDAAKCVIVMWSKASVGSRYVRGEAQDAAERGILVPALIEKDIRIPRGFRAIHAADLVGWDGAHTAPLFLRLTDDIARLLGPPPTLVENQRKQAEAEATRRRADAKRRIEQEEKRGKAIAEAERGAREKETRRQANRHHQPRSVDSFERNHLLRIAAWLGPGPIILWVMGMISGRLFLVLIILAALAVLGIHRLTGSASSGLVKILYSGRGTTPPPDYSPAELLMVRGRHREAAEYLRDHLTVEPGDNEARLRLADLLENQLHDPDGAERLYLEVRRTNPDRGHEMRAANGLIDLYRKLGRRDRLMVELARFTERFGGSAGAEGAARLLWELKQEAPPIG